MPFSFNITKGVEINLMLDGKSHLPVSGQWQILPKTGYLGVIPRRRHVAFPQKISQNFVYYSAYTCTVCRFPNFLTNQLLAMQTFLGHTKINEATHVEPLKEIKTGTFSVNRIALADGAVCFKRKGIENSSCSLELERMCRSTQNAHVAQLLRPPLF
jgi:hypothetical protein